MKITGGDISAVWMKFQQCPVHSSYMIWWLSVWKKNDTLWKGL